MKKITAERILGVRERIGAVNDRRFKGIYDLVRQAAFTGLKITIDEAVGGQEESINHEFKKVGLEAQYHGIHLSQMSLEEIMEAWDAGLDNRHKWYRWLDRIQRHHNVSGLIEKKIEFQGRSVVTLEQHDSLDRTADDCAKLRANKINAAQFFLDSVDFNPGWNLMTDEGVNSVGANVGQIRAALAMHDFGDVYVHNHGQQLHLRLYTPESDREPCWSLCPNDSFVLYEDFTNGHR